MGWDVGDWDCLGFIWGVYLFCKLILGSLGFIFSKWLVVLLVIIEFCVFNFVVLGCLIVLLGGLNCSWLGVKDGMFLLLLVWLIVYVVWFNCLLSCDEGFWFCCLVLFLFMDFILVCFIGKYV